MNEIVIKHIMRKTSLSEVNVSNTLLRFNNIAWYALKMNMSFNLAKLCSFRLIVPPKMMDNPEEVIVVDALKTPKIVFTSQAEDTRCR